MNSLDCIICLSSLANGIVLSTLPCGHVYHDECITRFLADKLECPACRSPAMTKTRMFLDLSLIGGAEIVAELKAEFEAEKVQAAAENERLSRQVAAFDRRAEAQQANHEIELVSWQHDHDHWRRSCLDAEEAARASDERVRELEAQLNVRIDAEARVAGLERRTSRLRTLLAKIRETCRRQQRNARGNDAWGLLRASIRNIPEAAMVNPMATVIEVFRLLTIPMEDGLFKIRWSGPMIGQPGQGQILLEFVDLFSKSELVSKFQQLEGRAPPEWQDMEVRDAMDTTELFLQAQEQLRPLNGIVHLRMHYNQVEYKTRTELILCEINHPEQIAEIAQLVQSLPESATAKRKRLRAAQNRDDQPGTSAASRMEE